MKKLWFALLVPLFLAACAVDPVSQNASPEEVARAAYRAGGPATLTLVTVINNRSGQGGHTAVLVNAPSQRVIWDPAGSFRYAAAPEVGDVIYGVTDAVWEVYKDYHTRASWDTVLQEIQVSPEVAEMALKAFQANGATPKATCSVSTSRILGQLPGFESIPVNWFPKKTMSAFGNLPGVKTQTIYDNDSDDNSAVLQTQI